MPRRVVAYDCAFTPAAFWSLRDDVGFERYCCAADHNDHELLSLTEKDGVVTRVSRVTAQKNPVPSSFRGMLGCKDGFRFKITERWRRDAFDEAHPMTFETEPAVMADRIKVTGQQWAEPLGATGSRLFFALELKVSIKGVGAAVARGIENGAFDGYKMVGSRVLEYLALRRKAAEAASMDRGSRLSERGSRRASRLSDAGADRDTEPMLSTAATSEADELEDDFSERARHRWRLALMGVRFQRALERQRTDEFRLCEACVDEPRNEGRGPKKHTTYRVSSHVRQPGGSWTACRKRFSDFEALRRALEAFLPGAELPPLPPKSVPNRHSAAVIESRRVGLEDFLQRVLDHPMLSTCDELAEFLQWPESVRAPLFERNRTFMDVPASSTRRALAKAYSLRKLASEKPASENASPGLGRVAAAASAAADEDAPVGNRPRADTFSDALAAAMVSAVEGAAVTMQTRAREASMTRERRQSRLSSDGEGAGRASSGLPRGGQASPAAAGAAASPAHVFVDVGSGAAAGARAARAPPMSTRGAHDAVSDGVTVKLLQRIEELECKHVELECRLAAVEEAQGREKESSACCCAVQ